MVHPPPCHEDSSRKSTYYMSRSSISLANNPTCQFTVDASRYAIVQTHAQACGAICFCLPGPERVGLEYRCTPVPADLAPPLGEENYLMHYFLRPECAVQSQDWVYQQVPKRMRGQLFVTPYRPEFAWGVCFQEGWHWKTIYFLLVVVVVSGSLVFSIVWTQTRADIQGAFAVSSYWVAVGCLMVGGIGVRSNNTRKKQKRR